MDSSNLESFLAEVSCGDLLRVEDDLGHGYVRLRVSEAERRQAKQDIRCVEDAVIEMLRNARDAHARTVFLATTKSADTRILVMIDDGDGVPASMVDRIFEPRVTSKLDSFSQDDWGVHGRGMALYSIRENAREARVVASVEGQGSAFRVVFDTADVPERKDQSTLATLARDDAGEWAFGPGPRNIARATAEFALASRESCTVYMGSPVEIAATLRAFGARYAKSLLAHEASRAEIPPAKRLSVCVDAAQLVDRAAEIGLELSTRSAYRILQGEIEPLRPLLGIMRDRSSQQEGSCRDADVMHDFRGLKIASADMADFTIALKKSWADLAAAYYLEADVEPRVRVSRDGVHVTFPAHKQL